MTKQQLYEWLTSDVHPPKTQAKSLLINHYPKIFEKIKTELGGVFTIHQLYDFLQPRATKNCLTCGKATSFSRWGGFYSGYARFCGPQCSNRHDSVKSRKVESYRARYGVDNPSQSVKVKAKKICYLQEESRH